MPCPECDDYRQRVIAAEAAEQSLLLFTETFSNLSRQLWQIEQEAVRRQHQANPPPTGAAPVRKRRYLLVPVDVGSDTGASEAAAVASVG